MALIVQKFGGSSVADRERIFHVARLIAQAYEDKNRVVVVVSAQGDTTDLLIEKAGEISRNPSGREMDMLLSSGEQISVALLCMALGELGIRAVSLTGWQAGFRTDRLHTRAHIRRLETERIVSELDKNQVVIVAGFQGLDSCEDITTLGRGGSDTSAVAIACALSADVCRIYTDVAGVYTADPRLVPRASRLPEITFDEMLELAAVGAQVLHSRSVELAKKYGIELEVLSSLQAGEGTLVREACEKMEGLLVKSVTADKDCGLVTVHPAEEREDMSFKVLSFLASRKTPFKLVFSGGTKGNLLFLTPAKEAETICSELREHGSGLGVKSAEASTDCACLSLVGSGLGGDSSALPLLLEVLKDQGLTPQLFTAGEIRISALIPLESADTAVRAVHEAFFERV